MSICIFKLNGDRTKPSQHKFNCTTCCPRRKRPEPILCMREMSNDTSERHQAYAHRTYTNTYGWKGWTERQEQHGNWCCVKKYCVATKFFFEYHIHYAFGFNDDDHHRYISRLYILCMCAHVAAQVYIFDVDTCENQPQSDAKISKITIDHKIIII